MITMITLERKEIIKKWLEWWPKNRGVHLKDNTYILARKAFEFGIELASGQSDICSEAKPPPGPKPEIFYQEQRLRDLAKAINDYVSQGFFGGEYAVPIELWCAELTRRLKEFR